MGYQPGQYPDRIIGLDYDGCLVEDAYPGHGAPRPGMAAVVDRLRAQGYHLLVHTARTSLDAADVTARTGIGEVHTGKPIADLYLDDKGLHPPTSLIEALVEQHFTTPDGYLAALTSGRLTSPYAQNIGNVPENPAYQAPAHDDGYRVFIPLTGGMDSTTLWQMAVESGLPVHPIYLDCGQEYARLEIDVARATATAAGHDLEVVTVPVDFKRYDHILLGRNALVIYTIAQLARDRGQWGEVWFGNLAGESPVWGGDKSRRFFNDTQALLTLRGHDLRIVNPLMGMDKPDEVAYWLTRDIDRLAATKSCFSAEHHACGECQTCFRKWVAFQVHGIDVAHTFARADVRSSFAPYTEKYRKVMGDALARGDFSHYSPSRIASTLRAIDALTGGATPEG